MRKACACEAWRLRRSTSVAVLIWSPAQQQVYMLSFDINQMARRLQVFCCEVDGIFSTLLTDDELLAQLFGLLDHVRLAQCMQPVVLKSLVSAQHRDIATLQNLGLPSFALTLMQC